MQNLNNFSNFELTTQEAQNVNGGRLTVVGRRTSRRTVRTTTIETATETQNAEVQEMETYEETLHAGLFIY